MDKTKKLFKILGIITACIICLGCIGVDAWWAYIYKFGHGKIEDNVVYADEIQATDGTKANIFEVNYYANANKNGVEMLEIKLSGLTDSNASAIYSQGLQYVANDSESSIRWNYVDHNVDGQKLYSNFHLLEKGDYTNVGEEEYIAFANISTLENSAYNYKKYNSFSAQENIACFQHMELLSGGSRYNYASSDNFENDIGQAVNPIDENTFFHIQLSDSGENGEVVKTPYAFKFRGARTVAELLNAEEKPMYRITGFNRSKFLYTCNQIMDIYPLYDVDFLAWRLYEKVKSMPAGSNQFTLVEMGDWLEYYSVDENSTLIQDRLPVDKTNKVKTMFSSYYGMKITVYADGATKASDSIFKTIAGSANFNISASVDDGDYFYGRTVITIGNNAFEHVDDAGVTYFKLKQAFIKEFGNSKELIVLKIVIDKDELLSKGKTFGGFAPNSGLEAFGVQGVYMLEKIGGVLVKSEVTDVYAFI